MKRKETNVNIRAVSYAVLAAALYGISAPVSKLLLLEIPPTFMAALLYLGAGSGMLLVNSVRGLQHNKQTEARITRKDFPFVAGMIGLDIAAPIFLMLGLAMTTSANASLLNNFEIAATSLIALFIFKEAIGKRMWLAITLITLSCIVLTVEDYRSFSFSTGSLFVILACICWGFENNCTRMLSMKDPTQIVVIKGFGSGIGSLVISIIIKQYGGSALYVLLTLLLGFVAYGLSIFFYIHAQRKLGAARTSAYYAAAPFIGVLISWIIFGTGLTVNFVVALLIMLAGSYLAASEVHKHLHRHETVTHEHKHNHTDEHHTHVHEDGLIGEHSHIHTHDQLVHNHTHTPDIHHSHGHNDKKKLS